MRRHAEVTAKGFCFVDAGTSGGVWGLKEGYALMIGGDEEPVKFLTPIFAALAPAADRGWGHVGPAGAGHFVKMVHNGIEYGMMQLLRGGLHQSSRSNPCTSTSRRSPKSGVMAASSAVGYSISPPQHSKKIRSSMALKLTSPIRVKARWTVFEAIDLNVSAPVITESLIRRIRSREENNFTDRMIAIQRNAFGGHAVKKD